MEDQDQEIDIAGESETGSEPQPSAPKAPSVDMGASVGSLPGYNQQYALQMAQLSSMGFNPEGQRTEVLQALLDANNGNLVLTIEQLSEAHQANAF